MGDVMLTLEEYHAMYAASPGATWSVPDDSVSIGDKLVFDASAMRAVSVGRLFANGWDARSFRAAADSAIIATYKHARETKAKRGDVLSYVFKVTPTDSTELKARGNGPVITVSAE
jgi:hypothetical protein